jgi:hypothetical protein
LPASVFERAEAVNVVDAAESDGMRDGERAMPGPGRMKLKEQAGRFGYTWGVIVAAPSGNDGGCETWPR